MREPKIVTHYNPKPIPDRNFDWSAWVDGGNENQVGYGATWQEAFLDLAEQLVE